LFLTSRGKKKEKSKGKAEGGGKVHSTPLCWIGACAYTGGKNGARFVLTYDRYTIKEV
jgi:hypothetical protein